MIKWNRMTGKEDLHDGAKDKKQKQAMGFYQKQGYNPVGDYYMDEQCPHIWMQKEVNYVK